MWYVLLVVILSGAFWFSACVSDADKKMPGAGSNVVITQDRIIMPGTSMTKADGAAMNKILNQYDKTLYRVDTYENGKRTKTQGKLTDVVTDGRLASELAANLKKEGFSQYAVQIRASGGTNPASTANSPVPGPSTNPTSTSPVPGPSTNPASTYGPVPGASTNPTSASTSRPKTNDSFERLKAILSKYQRK